MNAEAGAFHVALVNALGDLTNPQKDGKADTGKFGYTYATLPAVLDHVRPVLAAHGLAITQDQQMADHDVAVTTTIWHTSGEHLTFGPLVGRASGDWQQTGSALTYMRRYSLLAALGIAGDDDDDAQAVKGKPVAVQRVKPSAPPMDDPWQTHAPLPTDPDPTPEEIAAYLGGTALTVDELRQQEAPVIVPNHINGPLANTWGRKPASEPQRKYLGAIARERGNENTAAWLDSDEVIQTLGGRPSSPINTAHASTLLDTFGKAKK